MQIETKLLLSLHSANVCNCVCFCSIKLTEFPLRLLKGDDSFFYVATWKLNFAYNYSAVESTLDACSSRWMNIAIFKRW